MGGVFSTQQHIQITTNAPAVGCTIFRIANSLDPVSVLDTNTNRKGCVIFNQSVYSLYLKFGTGVSRDSMTVNVAGGSLYEMASPVYAGIIEGVWEGQDDNGFAHVTELV